MLSLIIVSRLSSPTRCLTMLEMYIMSSRARSGNMYDTEFSTLNSLVEAWYWLLHSLIEIPYWPMVGEGRGRDVVNTYCLSGAPYGPTIYLIYKIIS